MKYKNVFAAIFWFILMALGGQFEIPLGPVPFILTDLFVFIAALSLPYRWFGLSMLLFLTSGAVGLPVFAGGSGGVAHLFGPTSGYLFGYLFGGLLARYLSLQTEVMLLKLLGVWFGYYLLFALGILGLVVLAPMSIGDALSHGFTPFIFSMHIKGALAFGIVQVWSRYRNKENSI